MINKRLVIIGAGGHGKVCAEIAELNGYDEIVFLDDSNGLNVAGKSTDWPRYAEDSELFVAIGNSGVRKKLLEEMSLAGCRIATLIHPSSTVSKYATIKTGTVVMAGAVINTSAFVGQGSIINTCSSVDHDCVIGEYSHISVGAHLCGTVFVGANVWVGAGATVKNNISICADAFIGAGAVVVKDIDEIGVYVGVPARKLK